MSRKQSNDSSPATDDAIEMQCVQFSSSAGKIKNKRSNATIYRLFSPISRMGKYIGLEPLIGIYEVKCIPRYAVRPLFQFALPLLALQLQGYAAYEKIRVAHEPVEDYSNVSDIDAVVIYALIMFSTARCVACTGNLLINSTKMVVLLKHLNNVNDLFAAKFTMLRTILYAAFMALLIMDITKEAIFQDIIGIRDSIASKYAESYEDFIYFVFLQGDLLFIISKFIIEVTYIGLHLVLATCLRTVNKSLSDVVAKSDPEHGAELRHEKLAEIRQSYVTTFDLAAEMDNYFSAAVLTIFVVDTVELAIHLYITSSNISLVEGVDEYFVPLLILATIPFAILVTFCLVAESTTTEAMKMSSILYKMQLPIYSSKAVVNEIQMLANLANGPPLSFTAAGFVTVNKSLLVTIMGIATSYVIIMVQFSRS